MQDVAGNEVWILLDSTDSPDGDVVRDVGQHVLLACPVLAVPPGSAWLHSGCSPKMLVMPPLLQAEPVAKGGHLALVPVHAVLLLPLLAEVAPPP